MIYNKQTMPWRLTLIYKLNNKKHVYYKSTTEYLEYNEESFTCEEEHQKTQRTSRQTNQMQIL